MNLYWKLVHCLATGHCDVMCPLFLSFSCVPLIPQIDTNVRDELIEIFTDFRSQRRRYEGKKYLVQCCSGIAIDLLNAVARDLHFDYDLYLVADGLFGVHKDGKWDGVTADLVSDLAHLSFTAFSTTSSRIKVSHIQCANSLPAIQNEISDVPSYLTISTLCFPHFGTKSWLRISFEMHLQT